MQARNIVVASLLMLGSVAGAQEQKPSVTHGYNGGPNYAGINWHFADINSQTGNCGAGPCFSLSYDNRVSATVIQNGKVVCNEQTDLGKDFDGKWFWLCGQPAIIDGTNTDGTLRAYYHAPNGTENWVDSPAHCYEAGLINHVCDHYWYVNW
jgi:hypothetical protein